MRRLTFILLLGIAPMLFFLGCKSKSIMSESQNDAKVTGLQVVIYKTKDNYYLHVPVNLSADKKSLVSYPAPSDVIINGELMLPVKLENGFLLDRRGISEGCAFLKWTYYEYSRLDHTPDSDELMKMILEIDPLTEMYFCGRKGNFQNLEPELNQVIREGKLDNFKRIK
jgi:hypothetical protein